jgi:hypothetical protein
MENLTLKEQRQQLRKWYLMTNIPVPEYLKEENHLCDPDSFDLDPVQCPACKEIMVNRFEGETRGEYR